MRTGEVGESAIRRVAFASLAIAMTVLMASCGDPGHEGTLENPCDVGFDVEIHSYLIRVGPESTPVDRFFVLPHDRLRWIGIGDNREYNVEISVPALGWMTVWQPDNGEERIFTIPADLCP